MQLNKIPLSARIIIAMLAGLVIGGLFQTVFIGVETAATAFVTLLQMTALPYIALSLIVGIGSLSPDRAKATFKQSLLVLLVLLAASLFFIMLAPIAFPDWENAEFYSANTVKASTEFDFVGLFIPANPFNAFANAVIPSVVLFSIFIGIGLMAVKGKKRSLLVLNHLLESIANVSNLIMRFAPIGVFCIALKAAATIDASQISGLVVYIVTSAIIVALLAFIILPAIVATVTPLGYRQIIRASREAMVTAFATGSFFIVIPLIVEKTKYLIRETMVLEPEKAELATVPDILVPISFSLPVGGKLIALLFTLFAAWFSGTYVGFSDYLKLIFAGLPQLFGTSTLAMPNLLEIFNVSGAMFEFFLVAESLIVGRISALFSVIFAVCLPLLIAASIGGQLKFKWKYFGRNLVLVPILTVLALVTLRFSFDAISHQYQGYSKFIERDFLYGDVATRYLDKAAENGATAQPFTDVLTRIKKRGFIRVGYFRDDLPYSFHNHEGKLVGFDIEIMNQLAADLGVTVEFVKIFHDQAAPLLASGYLDITSGVPVIPDNMKEFTLTIPYSRQSIAFIVKDERRAEFKNWQDIINRKDLIIGIPEIFFYQDAVERYFVHGKAWKISTPRLFFREEYQHIDGMLFGAAAASGWTLLNPEYTVIVPKPVKPALSMAFPINRNDQAFELFMRNWIEMKTQNKMLERLFSYWVEGKKPE